MLAHLQRIILTASKTLFGARLVCEGAPELLDQLTHTPFVIEEAKFLRTFAEFTHKITEKMSSFFFTAYVSYKPHHSITPFASQVLEFRSF